MTLDYRALDSRMPADPSPPATVDLNADLGEEVTDDAGLLGVVTSANVACGFHAGTPAIMRTVCAEAARLGVAVGRPGVLPRPRRASVGSRTTCRTTLLRDQVAEQVALLVGPSPRDEGTRGALREAARRALPPGHRRRGAGRRACWPGSGELPVLGFPGSRLLALRRGARPRDVRGGVPRPRLHRRPADRPESAGRAALESEDAIAAQAVRPGAAGRVAVRARRLARRGRPRARRTTGPGGRADTASRRSSSEAGFSTGRGLVLWRMGGRFCGGARAVCGGHAEYENLREILLAEPLAPGCSWGIELSLPTRRLRWEGAEKKEDPDRELARGVGRWRQAGSECLSGIECHRTIIEGLLVLIPSRAPHLFQRYGCAPSPRRPRRRSRRGRLARGGRLAGDLGPRASPGDRRRTRRRDGAARRRRGCRPAAGRRPGGVAPDRGGARTRGRDTRGLRRAGPRDRRRPLGLPGRGGRGPTSGHGVRLGVLWLRAGVRLSLGTRGRGPAAGHAAHPREGRVRGAGRELVRRLPAASPGGWQIIGHTDADLWDPGRERAGAARTGHAGEVRGGVSLEVGGGPSVLVQDRVGGWAHLKMSPGARARRR